MAIRVRIPAPPWPVPGGLDAAADGATVGQVLARVVASHPDGHTVLFESGGRLRGHVEALVNGHGVRLMEGLATPVHNGDEIAVIQILGGG